MNDLIRVNEYVYTIRRTTELIRGIVKLQIELFIVTMIGHLIYKSLIHPRIHFVRTVIIRCRSKEFQ